MLTIKIDQDLLQEAVEAMRDLKAYYEADAAALAKLDSIQARHLAQERLERAEAADRLYEFFGAQ